MLRRLSGREHTVYTGVAVRRISIGLRIDQGVSSQVEFKPFGEAVIEEYVRLVNTLDKAGAYSIQEHTEMIVAGYQRLLLEHHGASDGGDETNFDGERPTGLTS
jgi:septum formation protein